MPIPSLPLPSSRRLHWWIFLFIDQIPASGEDRILGETERIPALQVTANLPKDQLSELGSRDLLTAEALDQWRPLSLHDAFDMVAGVRTIDDDSAGRRSGIGIRGAPPRRSRKVLLLEEGSPINASTYLDPSAHYTPPLERIEQIEILKGSGEVRHGPINNHGIINFTNHRPTPSPQTTLHLAIGNQGTRTRHLRHTRTDGSLGSVFAYTGTDMDGSFDIEHTSFEDFFSRLEWSPATHHHLGLSLVYFRERSVYDESNLTPQEYAVAPRKKSQRFGQEHHSFALDYFKVDLVHTYERSVGGTIATRMFATDVDRPRFSVDPGEVPVDRLPLLEPEDPFDPVSGQGRMIGRLRYYRTYGGESLIDFAPRTLLGREHRLQAGLRAERQFLNDRRSAGQIGEILRENRRGTRTRDEAYQSTAASLFVQDFVQIGPWAVASGVRVEHYTQSKVRLSLPADPGPHAARDKDARTLFLPAINLRYEGFMDTVLFANLGRGYIPAFARTASGFPLEPETGINSQIGLRSSSLPGLTLEAAAFYNVIRDTIVQLPFTIDHQNVFLNSADSLSYGLDLEIVPAAWPLFGSRARLISRVAYNFTQAEFSSGLVKGRRVPEVPLHAGSVTVGLDHAAGWKASVTLSHFGDFYTDPANTEQLTLADEDGVPLGAGDRLEVREPVVFGRVPSHTLLSARITYPWPHRQLTLWLQGRNLTDRLYIVDLHNGLRPGAARTWMAGASLQF